MSSLLLVQIPLAGYGGRSVLALSGACLTNSGQRWLELGALSVGHNIMREIVLTNSGVRAAFVKATAFYGEIWLTCSCVLGCVCVCVYVCVRT